MNLAVKDIQHNVGRFALTAFGIGMLLMVVMGMGGIYRGVIEDAILLIDQTDADIWVVQRDTRGPFAEVSRVPRTLVHRLAAVPGVESSREFVYHTIQREHEGRPIRIAVLGLSWPDDHGEWIPLIAGRPLEQNHFEMIADKTLGLHLGEKVRLGKETYTVVGISTGMIGTSGDGIAFFTIADAQAVQLDKPPEALRLDREVRRAQMAENDMSASTPALTERVARASNELPSIAPPEMSAALVRVAPGASVEEAASTISGWGDVSVYTQQQQKDLLLKGSVEKIRQQIGLFRVLLTIIAAIIMALILYTLTLDKIHSIALLKLIGAPNRVILGLIIQQALVLGVSGYAIAYFLGQQLFPRFPRRVILTEQDLIQLAVIVIVISILSSLLGIWRAMKVDPNEALS